MFRLDLIVYHAILAACTKLGAAFCLGAGAGLFIYLAIIAYGIASVLPKKENKK